MIDAVQGINLVNQVGEEMFAVEPSQRKYEESATNNLLPVLEDTHRNVNTESPHLFDSHVSERLKPMLMDGHAGGRREIRPDG